MHADAQLLVNPAGFTQNGVMGADLDELRRLRRARDRMDREYARPLDVPALARARQTAQAGVVSWSAPVMARRYEELYQAMLGARPAAPEGVAHAG